MDKREKEERKKMVLAMEYIARQVNDESLFDYWLSLGVADGDIPYGNTEIGNIDSYEEDYIDDETFSQLMKTFINLISYTKKSGGLYCGGIVSKE